MECGGGGGGRHEHLREASGSTGCSGGGAISAQPWARTQGHQAQECTGEL